jgi:predicted metal-dependent hydrolase
MSGGAERRSLRSPFPSAAPAAGGEGGPGSGGDIPVIWRRSPRARRMTLRIDPARRAVVLTLPARVSEAAAEAFLAREREWMRTRLAAVPEAVPFQPGVRIPIHGEFKI